MPRTLPPCLLIGALSFAAVDLAADEAAIEKLRARLKSAEQFGTECCQLLSIPAASFIPTDPDIGFDVSFFPYPGYLRPDFVVNTPMWAPVTLPSGAALDYIDLYYWDDEPGFDICADLHGYKGPTLGGNPPSDVTIGSVCSSGAGGFGYALEPISGTIDNSVWFSNGALYAVVIRSGVGAAQRFKGVTIWWHRQVSPPPVTATFNDVPTSHPQFQFIEALAESAITVGCGGGNYCPDSPLTRGQMAVFLAKALGLYWPF
jgi:S-layer homology domain